MLRSLFTSFFLAGSAMSLVPAEKPPSSLGEAQTGRVTFTHTSQRVVACNAKGKGKDLKCRSDRVSLDATTSVTLHPTPSAEVADKDKRQPVSIGLPKTSGPVEVSLAAGVWEIDWPGRNESDRFFVGAGDEFGIRLATQSGICKKQKDECILATDHSAQRVTIPKECRR